MYWRRRAWGVCALFGVVAAAIITLSFSLRSLPFRAYAEQRQVSRAIILGEPSITPLPSATPSLTLIPPSPTTTTTRSATPVPLCSLVSFENAHLADNTLQVTVRNDNPDAPVYLTHAEIQWSTTPDYPGMYASDLSILGRTRIWYGPDYTPPTIADRYDPNWNQDPPTYFLRQFDPHASTTLRIEFANGPLNLSNYFGINDFAGTKFYFSVQGGSTTYDPAHDCAITVPAAAPTPTPSVSYTPSQSPVLNCADYALGFGSFETSGVVRFVIANQGTFPVSITGFQFNWTPPTAAPLDFIALGGPTAFDPAAIILWDGTSRSSPTVSSSGSGDPDWKVAASLRPGRMVDLWLDFDGTTGRLDNNLGYTADSFAGSTLTINGQCEITLSSTPLPTVTRTPYTPRPTSTPSNTPLPTRTLTPTPSATPSCNKVRITSIWLVGSVVEIGLYNENSPAPVFISEVDVPWQALVFYPAMYVSEMRLSGRSPFWQGADYSPNTIIDSHEPGWITGDGSARSVLAGQTLEIVFQAGPPTLDWYYTGANFTGTTVYFSTQWNGTSLDCSATLDSSGTPTSTAYAPLPSPTRTPSLAVSYTPSLTPVLSCGDYLYNFMGFESNGVVRYRVLNNGSVPANVTGFHLNWAHTPSAAPLGSVSVGRISAFDPTSVTIWSGSDTQSPSIASSSGGEPGWITEAVLAPGQIAYVWFDFDGTTGRLDTNLGYSASDLDGATLTIGGVCELGMVPMPTNTPTLSQTSSKTPLPTASPTLTRTPNFSAPLPPGCVPLGGGIVICSSQ